ncbi:RagB/SusD family nutrient uptake outer membrane protein [Flavobacterium algicola]|uniref:RagB/SusD family nutrient uptake outer membrane protein n=1 Tax=Flavobacterium algicola TaxID=556529 RepID=UPI001EFE0994|nr:RagB/SusD family nutrient uptake outer membrane protein [Flavobacterium algicola]MCG9790897.1 RagB/SusD family nutrient uptake outer membrane protein [Flavobacterium algicola]
MKSYKLLIGALVFSLTSCSDSFLEILPESYINEVEFFSTAGELNIALNACYAGMRAPAAEEWKFTELRSDNTAMNQIATTSVDNIFFLSYDAFFVSTNDTNLKNFWYYTYVNIKNNNILLNKMNVNYDGTAIVYGANATTIAAADIKDVASQACFLRAYHYFNLVRLFGDVFLVHEPVASSDASILNRAPQASVYNLIIADLLSSIANGNSAKYSSITATNAGKANVWAAKALLAKVYLTLGRKAESLALTTDIIANSGYDLESTAARVYATTNELNKEILFTIRYKSGNIGLGSPFTCDFAPAATTGGVTVTGNQGDNAPTVELYNSFNATDGRRAFVGQSADVSLPRKLYYTKFHAAQTVRNDSEFDFPIIRYADVLLMYAEAAGRADANSLVNINKVRTRATGLTSLVASNIDTDAKFNLALANERRWEFAGENQRWYDLLRYGTTLPTLNAVDVMRQHLIIDMQPLLYSFYTDNAENVTPAILSARVNANSMFLPIPQIELDTNNTITITQNAGYN